MTDLVAVNGREALIHTAYRVMEHGYEVRPRGKLTRELRHFSVTIENPYDVLCTGMGANQSTEVVAAEAIQLIGGFSSPEFAAKHAPLLASFRNSSGGFDGAYGPRFRSVAQATVKRLQDDADTRQAIVPIWNASDANREQSLDYPCTLTIGFYVRAGKLEADVAMRSNDVNWGFKNDMFQFTQLQLSLANVLGLEAGPYHHTAFSMHVYEKDFGWVDGLDYSCRSTRAAIEDHPEGISGTSAMVLMSRAQRIALSEDAPMDLTASERWYRRALKW